ncbi:PH domain-containing protein [Marinococcus halophilus]|uniref:PH domain-containing protein n=1 Tax=Marinococcus halophilus TaxID=1371 RepID=UPI0015C46F34|nr:PH domain-containing protein [Marinococcus halophilus]
MVFRAKGSRLLSAFAVIAIVLLGYSIFQALFMYDGGPGTILRAIVDAVIIILITQIVFFTKYELRKEHLAVHASLLIRLRIPYDSIERVEEVPGWIKGATPERLKVVYQEGARHQHITPKDEALFLEKLAAKNKNIKMPKEGRFIQ